MTLKRGIIASLAILTGLSAIIVPLVINDALPEETRMQENTAVKPATEPVYRLATFAMG